MIIRYSGLSAALIAMLSLLFCSVHWPERYGCVYAHLCTFGAHLRDSPELCLYTVLAFDKHLRVFAPSVGIAFFHVLHPLVIYLCI